MKVITNEVKVLYNCSDIVPEDYEHVEQCARVCYRSENATKKNETSKAFVKRVLLKHDDYSKNHMSVLEHTPCFYKIPIYKYISYDKLIESKYSKTFTYDYIYVSTNLRVIYELGLIEDSILKSFKCNCTENHEKRYTVLITTNRGICDEFLRHRNLSFSHESTRYCNYSKDKFDNQISYILDYTDSNGDVKEIKPGEYGIKNINGNDMIAYKENGIWKPFLGKMIEQHYLNACLYNEESYKIICEFNNANFARQVLPLGIASRLVISGFESDFKELIDIRYNERCGIVHPSMFKVAKQIKKLLNL